MPSHNPPAPPPNPSLPFFTIDTLSAILLRPLLSPTVALLPPLILLALRREPLSSPVLLAVCLTLALLLIQGLLALDARLAAGEKRALRWADEVVVVAGGEGGLGKCIAEMLGMRGADVAVVDVLDEDERRQAEWEEKGCRYYRCDVGDREAVRELRRRISRDMGLPTILIHAVAVASFSPIIGTPPEHLERDMAVNLASWYHCVQTFLPAMLSNPAGGTVVTVSSVLGALGCAGLSTYTSLKSALSTSHASLKSELALLRTTQNASRVCTVLASPGQLSTPLFARVAPPSAFFGPTVSPAALAAEIVAAVDRGVDVEIATPLYARWIAVLGVLPPGLRGLLRKWAGLDLAGWRAAEVSGGLEGGWEADKRE